VPAKIALMAAESRNPEVSASRFTSGADEADSRTEFPECTCISSLCLIKIKDESFRLKRCINLIFFEPNRLRVPNKKSALSPERIYFF
jgi:hypothetical protein